MQRLATDFERLTAQLEATKAALREAILDRSRVRTVCSDVDPSGSAYEVTWREDVRKWAKLADLDLDKHNPFSYWRN